MFTLKSSFLWSLWLAGAFSLPAQQPLQIAGPGLTRRKLHGRFLHITDIHPDPYYIADASQSSACHRKKPRKEEERSGYYGTPYSDCDSPFRLTNLTLDFLDKNWASEIDFVIWTGDNARHDNDRKLPRTLKEIYELNNVVATRMNDVFLSRGIPVVPSLGNNDVWPVGGCEYNDRDDPGNLQFDWLEVQLELFRGRGMQVWLSGHVPPSPGNYFDECYVRYVELSLRFQDTILGHLYGHMNNDHFFFVEAKDLDFSSDPEDAAQIDGTAQASAHDQLYDTLIKDFAELPKSGKKTEYADYAVVNVAPSVVPNPYLPSFRIFSYNVTGAGSELKKKKKKKEPKRKHGHRPGGGSRDKLCKEARYQDSWRCKLREPWHTDAEAPSRQNTLWSPLGYAQYYLPGERVMNKTHRPQFKLEYLTYRASALVPAEGDEYPVPPRHLPGSLRGGNGTGTKYTPYGMEDLTLGSWLRLARALGGGTKGKLRGRFRRYMYMSE
ncbi:hypothetical protein FA95DRAFT_1607798 [Auriscalpium vulgare]|uniref:Uncharacterized protein n=1 Tax=Auriscalpium vulgare TaxID=40419 RepID=A0ACB8RM66_9AGAM|nr:hypothetical protein FA95DRAFT_1607798 [Auriscalpium vulgare]